MPKLLIIEDDLGLCGQYRWAFPDCEVLFAHDRAQALALALQERPAVAIMDLGLPPDPDGVSEGFATLDGMARQAPDTKIIVATSHGDRNHALRAIAAGAYDFCEKPIDIALLGTIVARSLRLHTLEDENRRAAGHPGVIPGGPGLKDIVTADPGMQKICREIDKLAATAVTVALQGEAGTGKAALARALHDLGPRAAGPFVTLSCGAMPEALLETELFGHERGAFSGAVTRTQGRIEAAAGGTLFLDEVGELPRAAQVRVLRVLKEGVFERVGGRETVRADVRVVTGSSKDLQDAMAQNRFSGDLYYRLHAMTLRIPPLRERGGDVVLLARFFLAQFAREFGRQVRGLTDDALAALATHAWPGNIRELENRMKRAVVMAEARLITAADLELAPGIEDMTAYDLRGARARAEREVVQRALSRSNGTLATAARLLGVSRPTLYSLLELHGLSAETEIAGRDAVPDDAASGSLAAIHDKMSRGIG